MSDDEMRDLVMEECRDKMRKAIVHLQGEFAKVRTGRANSGLVEQLRVDYYGAETPLQQLASFGVPEPRVLTISPFDKKTMRQAVAHVLEPEEILAAIAPKGLYTMNSSPFFPNQTVWFSKIGYDTYAKRDLKKARDLIAASGLTPPVAITVISIPVSQPGGRQIQVAVQQLEESGLFKVDLQIMDWTVMVQKRWEKKHNAMYNAFNVWYQNDLVAPTWNNPQHPASGFLFSKTRDDLLERRLRTTNPGEIAEIRDEFHRWFWDEVPLFPFGNIATLDGVAKHVKGSQHIGGPIYFGVWFEGKK